MYDIAQYGRMITDDIRMNAYARALKGVIGPDSVVLDIGAGTGVMSFLACQFGARKVYAVEPSDAIVVARSAADANGFSERIEFIQRLSTELSLPEKADVIVADLRGVLPLFHTNLESMADARERLLADGGTLIPQQDSLWVAIAEAPKSYDRMVLPWTENRFDLNMDAARRVVTNTWRKEILTSEQLLCEPRRWTTIDYATVESPNCSSVIEFRMARAGLAHGLVVWFDSVLAEGVEFSNAPGQPELIYGSGFFPWTSPVPLQTGDTVSVRLRADLVGHDYVWSWESKVCAVESGQQKAHFRQSTFLGSTLSPQRLRKKGASYRPVLGDEGRIERLILEKMDGASSNQEIACELVEQFPNRFKSPTEALTRVGELADRYADDASDQKFKRQ